MVTMNDAGNMDPELNKKKKTPIDDFFDHEPQYVVMSNDELGASLRKMSNRIDCLEQDLKLTKLKLAVAEETLSSALGVLSGRL